jgi:hypothetical protein
MFGAANGMGFPAGEPHSAGAYDAFRMLVGTYSSQSMLHLISKSLHLNSLRPFRAGLSERKLVG